MAHPQDADVAGRHLWENRICPGVSSMTVLWVSICKNGVDFLLISAFRQKSA